MFLAAQPNLCLLVCKTITLLALNCNLKEKTLTKLEEVHKVLNFGANGEESTIFCVSRCMYVCGCLG